MQIHEIFRRPANEGILKGVPVLKQKAANFAQGVSNFAQRAAPIAGAVASNLGGQILKKAGLPSSTGLEGPVAGYGAAQDMAAKVNEPLIKQQAKAAMEKWNKSLAALPGGLNAQTAADMKRGLWRELHTNILRGRLGGNYQNLPGQVWPTPDVQDKANKIVASLGQALQAITSNMSNTTIQDWEALTRSAYQAMSLAQFENARTNRRLSKEEEAQRQVEIDRLKAEIIAKEQKLNQVEQQIKSGKINDASKAQMAATAIAKEIAANKEELASLMLNREPNTQASNRAPAAAAPAAAFGKGTPMPMNPYQVPGARTNATPVQPTAAAPSFGKGTPMPMNPYQVPGARTSAKSVPPTPATPAGPRVVSGGPTPAERAKLAQRIAQATGTKA